MSLSIEGLPVLAVRFEPVAVTRVSPSFYRRLTRIRGPQLLFTTAVPSFPTISSVVTCLVELVPEDVVLGLDWASHVREHLIQAGFRLGGSFDARTFLTHPDHPIRGVVSRSSAVIPSVGITPASADVGSAHINSETYFETYSETLNPRAHCVPVVTLSDAARNNFVAPRSESSNVRSDVPGTQFVNFEPPPRQRSPTPPVAIASSSRVPCEVKVSVERRGFDAVDRLLLSPDPALNIFTMNAPSLIKLLAASNHFTFPRWFLCVGRMLAV
ncbi:hypothetical protein C8R47DRAFT_1230182 [Mycena vitilis]|nr:hypothetical protein C8R47DRAFT_1230182 [Mycena vitilis]